MKTSTSPSSSPFSLSFSRSLKHANAFNANFHNRNWRLNVDNRKIGDIILVPCENFFLFSFKRKTVECLQAEMKIFRKKSVTFQLKWHTTSTGNLINIMSTLKADWICLTYSWSERHKERHKERHSERERERERERKGERKTERQRQRQTGRQRNR